MQEEAGWERLSKTTPPRVAQENSNAEVASSAATPCWPQTSSEVDDNALRAVRHFHYGGPADSLTRSSSAIVPASIWPYRTPDTIRTDYPLLLFPGTAEEQVRCQSFAEGIAAVLPDSARLLKENLVRLERIVRDALEKIRKPVSAGELIASCGDTLAEQLQLSHANEHEFRAQLAAALASLPNATQVFGGNGDADIQLLIHVARSEVTRNRTLFIERVAALIDRLRELLLIDRGKQPNSSSAAALSNTIGIAGGKYINSTQLAGAIGKQRGSITLSQERRQRIEEALSLLESYRLDSQPLVVLVSEMNIEESIADEDLVELVQSENAVLRAGELFDVHNEFATKVIKAAHVAELELRSAAGDYEAAWHDAWFEHFDWQAFSKTELLTLPAIVAVTSDERLAGQEMTSFSQLALSGKPVKVIAKAHPASGSNSAERSSLDGFRFEPGYLAIGLREAFVWQSSSARPAHLVGGYIRALRSVRCALHVVFSGTHSDGSSPTIGRWMYVSAALESRAHPFFGYAPEAGPTSAERIDFAGNPEAGQDWPCHIIMCQGSGDEVHPLEYRFSFADFALLDPALSDQFRVVPNSCVASDALIHIADYLDLSPEDSVRRIPFVWGIDDEGSILKLVVSRRLTLTCRDRLSYWRTLQEISGVRNAYVDSAVAEAKEAAAAEKKEQLTQLKQQLEAEIERVRNETAAEALGKLAAQLTQLNPSNLAAMPTSPGTAPATRSKSTEEASEGADSPNDTTSVGAEDGQENAPTPETADEALTFDDPWIDTPLCTSCNDCVNMNQLLFVYDSNKQARIGDPRAGSYAQLVMAAEKCPARCIHPGKPLNPDEENLEEWVRRAEPFN